MVELSICCVSAVTYLSLLIQDITRDIYWSVAAHYEDSGLHCQWYLRYKEDHHHQQWLVFYKLIWITITTCIITTV